MATLIASAALSGVQPRALVSGVSVLHSDYTLSATLSAGDFINIGRIPNGGRVIFASVAANVAIGEAANLNLGDAGDHLGLADSRRTPQETRNAPAVRRGGEEKRMQDALIDEWERGCV